jgi:enoyl-CoA hydratase/carnithine racemase
MYLLLTGQFIDAHEAHRIGLVQEVVAHDRVLARAREIAELICSNAPMAVRMTKELALRSRDMTLPDGVRFYQALNRIVEASQDLEEGTRAFAEKRKPNFKNR